MPIDFECQTCHKRYHVADALAGKKAKCKGCGNAMTVPGGGAAPLSTVARATTDVRPAAAQAVAAKVAAAKAASAKPPPAPPPATVDDFNWDDLAGLEQSGVVDESANAPVRPPRGRRPAASEPDAYGITGGGPVGGVALPAPAVTRPLSYASPGSRRGNVGPRPAGGGGAYFVEVLRGAMLPWFLIGISYGLPLLALLVLGCRSGHPGPIILYIVATVCVLVFIVLRVAVVGLTIASKSMDFELPPNPGFRLFAAFCGVPIAIVIYALAAGAFTVGVKGLGIGGLLAMIGIGIGIGLAVSYFLVWFLFDLKPGQAAIAWLLGSLFYILGSIAGAFVMSGVGWLVGSMLSFSLTGGGGGGADDAPEKPGTVQSPSAPRGSGAMLDLSGIAGGRAEMTRRRVKSAANLRQIGQALAVYANENNGKYPPDLPRALTSAGLSDDLLHSPIGPAKGGQDITYWYVDGLSNGNIVGLPIVAYDQGALEEGQGTNVLEGDNSVEWLTTANFNALLPEARAKRDAIAKGRRPAATVAPPGAAPAARPPSDSPKPAVPLVPTGDANVDEKRRATQQHLRMLDTYLWHYAAHNQGHYAPKMDAIIDGWGGAADNLKSPFGPAPGGGPDYVYLLTTEQTRDQIAKDAIVMYDAAELAAGDGTTVVLADRHIQWMAREAFEKAKR